MADFSVNPQALKAKRDQLFEQNQQLMTKRNDLEARNNAMNGMWEGDARTAFDNAVRQDLAKIDEFINLIKLYCQSLDEIISKYVDAEQRNTDTATQRTYH